MTSLKLTPQKMTTPLKWHGGKGLLADWIVEKMPPHLCYVEPFAGGAQVLFAREPTGVEVLNDLDRQVVNLYRVLQDPDLFARFSLLANLTPYARQEWEEASRYQPSGEPVADAVALFVRCRQSMGGRGKAFATASRGRTRRGMADNVSGWLSAVEGLDAVHERLRRVEIECRPAVEVIRARDATSTLFYCDPPYVPDTRSSPEVYAHEMTKEDHQELLEVLLACKGKVMLSGYPSSLYEDAFRGWTRHVREVGNHAASGKKKARKIEVLWCNFGWDFTNPLH